MPTQYFFTDSNENVILSVCKFKVFLSLEHCWLFSPFHVKKGTKGNKNDQRPQDCRCWLGSDPGLSSVNRMWKIIVRDLKRTANVNVHVRYMSEGMHMFHYWPSRLVSQRGGSGSGHLPVCTYMSVVHVYMGITEGRGEGETLLQNLSNSMVRIRTWCSLSLPV